MRIHREIRALGITRSALTPRVTCKRGLFHASVNTGFFERLECRGLGVSKSGLRTPLRKRPTAPAGLYQQKFDSGAAHAITDGRDLLASAQAAQVGQGHEFRRRREGSDFRPPRRQT